MGKWLARLLSLIPILVSGVEQIHGDSMRGADKKLLVLEGLGLAGGIASGIAPEEQETIAAAMDLASSTIDKTKAVYNVATKRNQPPQKQPALAAAAGSGPALVPTTPAPGATDSGTSSSIS